jgi:drug/metabolite transporter (DMT)-like permease
MFNPMAFDWQDQRALIGNGVILLASFCWAANILYVRAHKWVSTPFQLVLASTVGDLHPNGARTTVRRHTKYQLEF